MTEALFGKPRAVSARKMFNLVAFTGGVTCFGDDSDWCFRCTGLSPLTACSTPNDESAFMQYSNQSHFEVFIIAAGQTHACRHQMHEAAGIGLCWITVLHQYHAICPYVQCSMHSRLNHIAVSIWNKTHLATGAQMQMTKQPPTRLWRRRVMRRRVKLGRGEDSEDRSGDDRDSGNERSIKRKAEADKKKRARQNPFGLPFGGRFGGGFRGFGGFSDLDLFGL